MRLAFSALYAQHHEQPGLSLSCLKLKLKLVHLLSYTGTAAAAVQFGSAAALTKLECGFVSSFHVALQADFESRL